jgi:hypothetical protein
VIAAERRRRAPRHRGDTMSEDELDRIVDIMRRLTPKQRTIVLGKLAILQASTMTEPPNVGSSRIWSRLWVR